LFCQCRLAVCIVNSIQFLSPIPKTPSVHTYGTSPLTLCNQHVIHQVKQNLQDVYTDHDYAKYLTKKYKWQPHTHQTIAWWVLHIALNRFTAPKQQILHKFLHAWLPLQTQPQVTSTLEGKLCPSCKQQPKDMLQFLSCQHISCKLAIIQLQQQLQTLHHKQAADWNLYQVLWQGLTSMLLQHDLQNPTSITLPSAFKSLRLSKALAGWIHALQGHFSKLWIHAAEQQGINRTIFNAKVTQICWHYVLTSWAEHNCALHDSIQLYEISQLWNSVQQIFHDAGHHPDTQATIHDPSESSTWQVMYISKSLHAKNFLSTS